MASFANMNELKRALTNSDVEIEGDSREVPEVLRGGTVAKSASADLVAAIDLEVAKKTEKWTETERRFYVEWLEPRLLDGTYVWVADQITLFQFGQSYTWDFVALRPDGGADHFEVKGSFALGSQSRSSVKVRWATTEVCRPGNPHRVYWAKWDGRAWKVRQVQSKLKRHPMTKGVKPRDTLG